MFPETVSISNINFFLKTTRYHYFIHLSVAIFFKLILTKNLGMTKKQKLETCSCQCKKNSQLKVSTKSYHINGIAPPLFYKLCFNVVTVSYVSLNKFHLQMFCLI